MTDREALEAAVARFHDAGAALDDARERLAAAIVAAARSGMRQVDIASATGYTRERIRQICRAAGLPGR